MCRPDVAESAAGLVHAARERLTYGSMPNPWALFDDNRAYQGIAVRSASVGSQNVTRPLLFLAKSEAKYGRNGKRELVSIQQEINR